VAAPSDPFNWLLSGLSVLWFVTPSLAIAATVFLSRSIAFAGAWYAFGLVAKKSWVRVLLAVAYALWPAFTAASQQGRLGAILAWMLLPWLALAGSKLLHNRGGRGALGHQASWTGITGLLLAAVAVSAPSLGLVLLVVLLIVIATNLRHFISLAWAGSLTIALFAPYAWFMAVGLGHPLAILSDPGLPVDSKPQQFWQILVGQPNGVADGFGRGFQMLSGFTLIFVLLAVVAWFSSRALFAAGLTLVAVLAASVGFVIQQSWFAPLEAHGSAASTSALVALCVLLAAGLALDSLGATQKRSVALVGAVAVLAVLIGSASSLGIAALGATANAFSFSDTRTEPAIVAAEAATGSHLRTLQIKQLNDNSFEAKLVSPGSLKLEANSTAYRYVLAGATAHDTKLDLIDQLVANLVSANGTDLSKTFADANIGFVMVSENNSPDLAASLNSVSELEPVGQTEFGWLWRVGASKDSISATNTWRQTWSLTKGIQLALILVFLLLALPSALNAEPKTPGAFWVARL